MSNTVKLHKTLLRDDDVLGIFRDWCGADDTDHPWAIHSRREIHHISRAAVDAIHKLTVPEMLGYEVVLPDIKISLWDLVQYRLSIIGWGIEWTSWELTPAELAAVHALTSPENLAALQAEADAEEAKLEEEQAEQERGQRIYEEAAEVDEQ